MKNREVFSLSVSLPYINQHIYVGNKIIDLIAKKMLSLKYDKLIAIIDINLYKNKKKYVLKLLNKLKVSKIIFIDVGEKNKNFTQCNKILNQITKTELSRKSCLIALGGGHVGDITGFIASIYMRGIDFIQIPSTLMSMSDAIIGKVSINNNGSKNLLGNFYSPKLTFCDISLLQTLSKQELTFGLVEIWKHALLENNKKIQTKIAKFLKKNKSNQKKYLIELIKFSLQTKKKYVEKDHNDTRGQHKALSLGHTLANRLEPKITISHGAAVFYGLIFSSILSKKFKTITPKEFKRIIDIGSIFEKEIRMLPAVQKIINVNKILREFRFDKINSFNTYTFVLLKKNGYFVYKNIQPEILKESLYDLKKIDL